MSGPSLVVPHYILQEDFFDPKYSILISSLTLSPWYSAVSLGRSVSLLHLFPQGRGMPSLPVGPAAVLISY